MHKPGLIDLSISFLCSVDQALESDKLRRESSPILFSQFSHAEQTYSCVLHVLNWYRISFISFELTISGAFNTGNSHPLNFTVWVVPWMRFSLRTKLSRSSAILRRRNLSTTKQISSTLRTKLSRIRGIKPLYNQRTIMQVLQSIQRAIIKAFLTIQRTIIKVLIPNHQGTITKVHQTYQETVKVCRTLPQMVSITTQILYQRGTTMTLIMD